MSKDTAFEELWAGVAESVRRDKAAHKAELEAELEANRYHPVGLPNCERILNILRNTVWN